MFSVLLIDDDPDLLESISLEIGNDGDYPYKHVILQTRLLNLHKETISIPLYVTSTCRIWTGVHCYISCESVDVQRSTSCIPERSWMMI